MIKNYVSWIHCNLFGWTTATELEFPHRNGFIKDGEDFMCVGDDPHYTTDPAAAFAVLKACIEEAPNDIEIRHEFNPWEVRCKMSHKPGDFLEAHGETLEISICQFAKKLYTNERKGV